MRKFIFRGDVPSWTLMTILLLSIMLQEWTKNMLRFQQHEKLIVLKLRRSSLRRHGDWSFFKIHNGNIIITIEKRSFPRSVFIFGRNLLRLRREGKGYHLKISAHWTERKKIFFFNLKSSSTQCFCEKVHDIMFRNCA